MAGWWRVGGYFTTDQWLFPESEGAEELEVQPSSMVLPGIHARLPYERAQRQAHADESRHSLSDL